MIRDQVKQNQEEPYQTRPVGKAPLPSNWDQMDKTERMRWRKTNSAPRDSTNTRMPARQGSAPVQKTANLGNVKSTAGANNDSPRKVTHGSQNTTTSTKTNSIMIKNDNAKRS